MMLPQIGEAGQQKLAAARVLLVGCGALGSTIAEQLVRAGVGHLCIADRDIVELTNLQRQVLFDESDARDGLPKAIAAGNRLAKINTSVAIEPRIVDVDALNIESLAAERDLILDGTDNVSTRYLINDVSVKVGIPWIYGGCVGTEGRVMTIRPKAGPCLRCLFPEPPDPRELPTCDTAGVLGPVASVVGSLQALAAIKLLVQDEALDQLLTIDGWSGRFKSVDTSDAKRPDCLACAQRRFEFLEARPGDMTARLCGRDAVQVRTRNTGEKLALKQMAKRFDGAGPVQCTPFMVRCRLDESKLSLTVFEDGRVLVQGTSDPLRARSVVARYVGL
jgi:adenylyltransferase/sulfurtransferase